MNNEFGIITKKIRNGESLRTMAKRLGISPAFLSAMEVGRKSVPVDYCEKIAKIYELSEDQQIELFTAICLSNGHIDISIENMNEKQQHICMQFARKINEVSDTEIEKIRKALMVNANE